MSDATAKKLEIVWKALLSFGCGFAATSAKAAVKLRALTGDWRPIDNWRKRHRCQTSFWLHMIGMPACFVVAPILLLLAQWWPALAAFGGGYALQFIGHLIEGNRSGEEMLARKIIERFTGAKVQSE